MEYVSKIKIQYIQSIFPSVDYIDQFSIEGRIYRTMESEPVLDVTKEKFTTIFNPYLSENVSIQSVLYTKHYIEFIVNESINIDTLKLGDELAIIDEYGNQFKIKYISAECEQQADTLLYVCRFEFYKIVNDSSSVSNYLTSEFLLSRTDGIETGLNRFKITAYKDVEVGVFETGNSFTFCTSLNPIFSRSEMKILNDEFPNNIKVPSASFDSSIIFLRFYLTETEKNNLLKYCERCYKLNGTGQQITLFNQVVYTAIESVKIEIPENTDFIGIYEVNIFMKYEKLDFYNY